MKHESTNSSYESRLLKTCTRWPCQHPELDSSLENYHHHADLKLSSLSAAAALHVICIRFCAAEWNSPPVCCSQMLRFVFWVVVLSWLAYLEIIMVFFWVVAVEGRGAEHTQGPFCSSVTRWTAVRYETWNRDVVGYITWKQWFSSSWHILTLVCFLFCFHILHLLLKIILVIVNYVFLY